MKQKQPFFTVLGIAFLVLGIVGIIVNIQNNTTHFLVWFSNHTSFILGLAFLYRSRFWITAELSIALIPETLWSIDFLSKLLFDKFVFGFTDYMFSPLYSKSLYWLSWNHLFILPVALIGLWLLGQPDKNAWKGSLAHIIILLIPSYAFSYLGNLNCVLESCVPFIPTNQFYPVVWILTVFVMILISNRLLVLVINKIKTATEGI